MQLAFCLLMFLQVKRATAEPSMNKKVLIIEDHLHMRTMLALTLRYMDYAPLEAEDGYARIENTVAEHPDLVLLDTYLGNVEQNDSRKIYRAKTPSTQRKIITYFSEPWRPLRLCARRVFPISISSENFKYLWLDLGLPGISGLEYGKKD
jgi:PleD family two-component response regulator